MAVHLSVPIKSRIWLLVLNVAAAENAMCTPLQIADIRDFSGLRAVIQVFTHPTGRV
jgi:hypothetical protein